MDQLINSWQDFSLGLFLVVAWSMAWKGLALWKAAGRKEKVWFVVLFVINTVGILEILYLLVFSNDQTMGKLKSILPGKKNSPLPPPQA